MSSEPNSFTLWRDRLIGALLLISIATPRAMAQTLQIFTDETVPPGGVGSDAPGRDPNVDLVREIQRRVGNDSPIQYVPWARAYHLALRQPGVLIFPTGKTAERTPLFQWVGPLRTFHARFFIKSGTGIRVASLDDAKKIGAVGVVRGSSIDLDMTALGFSNLDRGSDQTLVIRKLLAGRYSLIVDYDSDVRQYLKDNGGDEDALTPVGDFRDYDSNLAFSRGTPVGIVRLWQEALDALKTDGTFDRIYTQRRPGNR